METKSCPRCGCVKFESDFTRRKSGSLQSWCKTCKREFENLPETKERRKAQRQLPETKARLAAYRNLPERKEYQRKRDSSPKRREYDSKRRQTPEYKEYQRNYQKQNIEIVRINRREYQREYNKSNKWQEYFYAWRQSPEGKASYARSHARRKAIAETLPCDLTAEQWEDIKLAQGYRCAMCGEIKTLHRDHIIPVSKGGAFTKSNIQGLCRSCNSSKSNKLIVITSHG